MTDKIRVAILGATGYTALELIKILLRHGSVEITVLTSRQEDSPRIHQIHPQLVGLLDAEVSVADSRTIAERADCVFSCLPHAASASSIMPLLDAGLRVIDLSADYRLEDPAEYQAWYDHPHPDPARLPEVPYGLPELFRQQIRSAQLVANPGCFPTSAILPLAPLLKEKLVDPQTILIDSKSGVSGAGRTPKLTTHFPECNESVVAYNVGHHRHTPEIQLVLRRVSGQPVSVVFTPHLIPMDRGILTTAYARRTRPLDQPTVLACLAEAYRDEPFVQIVEHLPATKDVAHSNRCHITARVVGEWVIAISCLDNLIKGASGAAVQNMNVMYGFEETMGL